MRSVRLDPLGVVGLCAAVALWWVVSLFFSPIRVPGPLLAGETALKDLFDQPLLAYMTLQPGGFAPNLAYTVTNVLTGVTIGSIVGGAAGLASARLWMLRDLLDPILMVVGTVPILVAAPFLLMWFGPVPWDQIGLVAFYAGSLVAIAGQRAALNLPGTYEQYAASLGADRRRMFWSIVVPAAIPAMLGGLRVALATSWGLETIAELLGSRLGVGHVIIVFQSDYDTPGIVAIVLWLGAIAAVFDFSLERCVRWVTRWQS